MNNIFKNKDYIIPTGSLLGNTKSSINLSGNAPNTLIVKQKYVYKYEIL